MLPAYVPGTEPRASRALGELAAEVGSHQSLLHMVRVASCSRVRLSNLTKILTKALKPLGGCRE